MRLVIVRHGESTANIGELTQGDTNTRLTKLGRKQAKKVAKRLSSEKFDKVFVSDLDRALNTLKEILKFHKNLEPEIRKELREQSKGIYENTPRHLIHEEMARQRIEDYNFLPKGGETLRNVKKRIIKFFKELLKSYNGKNILMVGHNGPISCLLSYIDHQPIKKHKQYRQGSTGISIIELKNKIPIIKLFDCTKHLK